MMRHHFWRSGRWHRTSAEFRLLSGPIPTIIAPTSLTVRWTMSEGCQGWLEYATSEAGLSTPSETTHETSYSFSTHEQSISGLSQATTYWYRTVSVSQAGATVRSSAQSATTAGQPQSGYGVRYDLYGAGASGNFPTFPTGGSVVYAPTSILTASDVATALANWINAQADNKTLVLDSSGGGTAYGAGTEYVISHAVNISGGTSTTKRTGITLWGYNVKIRGTHQTYISGSANNYILNFAGGGFDEWAIRGLTIRGPNTNAGTYNAYDTLAHPDQHGIGVVSYDGFRVFDCDFEDLGGDNFYGSHGSLDGSNYGGWSGGPYPRDLELGYNRFGANGRQGVTVQQGTTVWAHHNIFEDSGGACWDTEDPIFGSYRYQRSFTIEDNVFRRWNWILSTIYPSYGWYNPAIAVITVASGVDVRSDWVIRRNLFEFGCAGLGNPQAELSVIGAVVSNPPSGGNSRARVLFFPAPWYSLADSEPTSNLSFTDNIVDMQTDQLNNYLLFIRNTTGVTITNNDLQGMDVRALNCSSVTFSGNSTGSDLVTT